MKSTRRKRWAALLLSGSVLPVLGTCLPEDYFAFSARAVSVAIADSILAAAVSPVFETLGLANGSQFTDDSQDLETSTD